ncbi:hypothetical protein ABZW18_03820 [Streptomyces sp. NPDC004647]|uniref:hypothetical protein n=1 Tax=Streptomyces sp. NPDC004647 TaxID=3154671 RepID=UPI0033BF5093
MRVHVLTRSWRRQDDYTWFPGRPEDRWWEQYGEQADFDYPVLLVETAGRGRWRAYIGGLTTSRDDAVGTPIRLSLALDGDCGARPETVLTAALVEEWLSVQAGVTAKQDATGCLDRAFDEDTVAGLFGGTQEVDRLIDSALSAYGGDGGPAPVGALSVAGSSSPESSSPPSSPKSSSPEISPPDESWAAGLAGAEARAAFVVHARGLLAGTAVGRALVLNSLGGGDALPRPNDAEHLIVLADGGPGKFGPTPVAIRRKAPPRDTNRRGSGRLALAALTGAAVGTAVLLRQALRLLRRSVSRNGPGTPPQRERQP